MYNHSELKTVTLETLQDEKMYVVGVLRKLLSDRGLSSSMYAITSYEKRGLIPKLRSNTNGWRSYTGKEIKEFISKLSERSEG
jgi:DNA-binding transcriptional MerR regulator